MKTAAVLIKETDRLAEGLRTCVGLLLAGVNVQLFVLHHALLNPDDADRRNLAVMDDMQAARYSDMAANVQNFGFTPITMADVARMIGEAEVVIPF